MLVLSLLSSLLMVSHCNLLLPIVKMVPVLMLLPGIFGVEIGSVCFSMSGFSTLLRALIFAPNCPDVISFMNVKKDGHMPYDERVREVGRACFSPLVFAATGDMGPTPTRVGWGNTGDLTKSSVKLCIIGWYLSRGGYRKPVCVVGS